YIPVLVITSPDKQVGRKQCLTPSPVKIVAQKYNIPLAQPDKIKNLKLKIENLNPDLGIVSAYGQIIPNEILKIPKHGFINVHPSLLPKYRGPSPIQYAILNNENKTGATIMLMDEKIDHGPILAQRELKIPNPKSGIRNKPYVPINKITFEELNKKLAEMGTELLIETIPKWINNEIKPQTQDESVAIYTKILKKEDGKIDWKKPAKKIEKQIQAFSHWPKTFTCYKIDNKIKNIKILKAKASEQNKYPLRISGKTFLTQDNNLAIQTGEDCLIVEKIQLEGKKEMTSMEFLRGHQNFINITLM
ncbi:MAG: methionyl-tRNA formyltransferase, partial [Patescibacteria group bacterium]|nr:methionyl-tRNA formyltransferase [Patescibacteria group bacterium]